MEKKPLIFLVASSGGHFEQILMLKPLSDSFSLVFITEKVPYDLNLKDALFTQQLNRKDGLLLLKFLKAMFYAFKITSDKKPEAIISTGALSSLPFLIVGKMMKKKIIFIESYAKSNTPTLTGKIVYKFADLFIVQWEEMKKVYPNAVFLGSIY